MKSLSLCVLSRTGPAEERLPCTPDIPYLEKQDPTAAGTLLFTKVHYKISLLRVVLLLPIRLNRTGAKKHTHTPVHRLQLFVVPGHRNTFVAKPMRPTAWRYIIGPITRCVWILINFVSLRTWAHLNGSACRRKDTRLAKECTNGGWCIRNKHCPSVQTSKTNEHSAKQREGKEGKRERGAGSNATVRKEVDN